jgi:hypothetical protein
MTLFPSALRSDRPRAMATPLRPLLGLRNLITRVLTRRRPLTIPVLSVVTSHVGVPHERAEPRLRWTDPWTAPGGDFEASAIRNAELDVTMVPRRGESWEAVSDFALSYDGYGYWDDLPTLAGRVLQGWTRRRSLPSTLDELRGCLFYEQRRWHHFGEDPSGRSADYMWAVVDAIGALASPHISTMGPIPDPRPAVASEAHVKLLPSPVGLLHSLPPPAPALRPLPARPGRLMPVPASETHVQLVSVIDDSPRRSFGRSSFDTVLDNAAFDTPAFDNAANTVARHPSGHGARQSWSHAGNPAEHPAMARSVRDLRPMPSADPLPKPPVIVRRSRHGTTGAPNRPGGTVNATRTSTDPWSSNGARRAPDEAEHVSSAPAEVTPWCREFFSDDTAYRSWVDAHPQGFVLNQPRSSRAKAPTLHRVGCAVVAWRDGDETRTTDRVRVCGLSADALRTWSLARGTAEPNACGRCCSS